MKFDKVSSHEITRLSMLSLSFSIFYPCRSGKMVACFRYASIDVFSVYLPPPKLEFNYDVQDWIQSEADEVPFKYLGGFCALFLTLFRCSVVYLLHCVFCLLPQVVVRAESLFSEVLNCIGQIAEKRYGGGTPDNGLISHESRNHICLLYTSPSPRD